MLGHKDGKGEEGRSRRLVHDRWSQDRHDPTLNLLLAAQVSHLQKKKKMKRRMKKTEKKA